MGDSIYAKATANRSKGYPGIAYTSIVNPRAFEWTSSDPRVATVSRAGVLYARSIGVATIRATAEGFSSEDTLRTAHVSARAEIIPPAATLRIGDTIDLAARAWDSIGAPIPIEGNTLFSTDGDARVAHVWQSLQPSGAARLAGLERGTTHVSWSVMRRCGVLPVTVR